MPSIFSARNCSLLLVDDEISPSKCTRWGLAYRLSGSHINDLPQHHAYTRRSHGRYSTLT